MDNATRDPKEPRSSRRAILLGAVGGIGAWTVGVLGRVAPVKAADGDVVHVGEGHAGSKATSFNVGAAGIAALWGISGAPSGASVGVRGYSVSGHSGAAGVLGESASAESTGVGVRGIGNNGDTGVAGSGRVGVFATSSAAGWMGIWGRHFGAGYGVAGDSVSHIGVSGASDATNQPGILARSRGNSTGILGFSGGTSTGQPAAPAKTGVFGQATQDSSSRGLWGKTTTGQGVRGEATTGAAVYGAASSSAGYAFRGSGRVRFDKVCGVASLAAGTTSKVITPGTDVTVDSFVLLTPGADIGTRRLWFTKDTTANTITIRMSSSRTSSTAISWLLLR